MLRNRCSMQIHIVTFLNLSLLICEGGGGEVFHLGAQFLFLKLDQEFTFFFYIYKTNNAEIHFLFVHAYTLKKKYFILSFQVVD